MCLNSSYTFENIIVFNICSDLIPEMHNFNVNQTLLLYYIYVDDWSKRHELTDYFGGYNSAQCLRYVKKTWGSCVYRRL